MVDIIYLAPRERMPDVGDDQPWLTVEASNAGQFFGTGGSWKADGEWIGYGSSVEDDVSLEAALAAAQAWATKYGVPTIWVQAAPWIGSPPSTDVPAIPEPMSAARQQRTSGRASEADIQPPI